MIYGAKDEDKNPINSIDENGNQEFQTETDMKWRIWDYDENKNVIRLISEKPTSQKLTLNGPTGYNNGVWLVNEICRQCYGQYDNSKERTGIYVSSLKRSDIQKVIKYNYSEYSHNNGDSSDKQDEGSYKYGNAKKYTTSNYCPAMWSTYDKDWKYYIPGTNEELVETDGNTITEDKEGLIWEKENSENNKNKDFDVSYNSNPDFEFKQAYWNHVYDISSVNEDDWINTKYYDLLFKNGNDGNSFDSIYWLSSRYLYLNDDKCDFGLQALNSDSTGYTIRGSALYYSSGRNSAHRCNSIRPIVSINLNSSGYNLEAVVVDDNIVSFNLK